MNHSEVIWLGDTLDVSINKGKRLPFAVTKCGDGIIELSGNHFGPDPVSIIRLKIIQNQQENKEGS